MSRKRYTPEQIISMLREAEVALAQGQSVGQAFRTLGVSEQSVTAQVGLGLSSVAETSDQGFGIFHEDRVPARGVRALRSTRLPAGRAGTFRLPRWAT